MLITKRRTLWFLLLTRVTTIETQFKRQRWSSTTCCWIKIWETLAYWCLPTKVISQMLLMREIWLRCMLLMKCVLMNCISRLAQQSLARVFKRDLTGSLRWLRKVRKIVVRTFGPWATAATARIYRTWRFGLRCFLIKALRGINFKTKLGLMDQ